MCIRDSAENDDPRNGVGNTVTNAISGIIILGALLQIGSSNQIVMILASISVLIATINIVGGFMVTRRMLAMFQKS